MYCTLTSTVLVVQVNRCKTGAAASGMCLKCVRGYSMVLYATTSFLNHGACPGTSTVLPRSTTGSTSNLYKEGKPVLILVSTDLCSPLSTLERMYCTILAECKVRTVVIEDTHTVYCIHTVVQHLLTIPGSPGTTSTGTLSRVEVSFCTWGMVRVYSTWYSSSSYHYCTTWWWVRNVRVPLQVQDCNRPENEYMYVSAKKQSMYSFRTCTVPRYCTREHTFVLGFLYGSCTTGSPRGVYLPYGPTVLYLPFCP